MMKNALAVFVISAALSCFGQTYAVYDATVHQQMVLNHNSKITSDNMTRQWLSTILQQVQIGQTTFVNAHKELFEKLKEIDERIGDPERINVNMTNVAPGSEYGNRKMEMIRTQALNGLYNGGNADADRLYGTKAEAGRAELVVEYAYINYESVLSSVEEDKATLLRKREALIAALPQLTTLAQMKKLQIALLAVDSKLKSIAETEKNAAMKVLAAKARNEEQRQLKEQVDQSLGAKMTVSATDAGVKQATSDMKSLVEDLKK